MDANDLGVSSGKNIDITASGSFDVSASNEMNLAAGATATLSGEKAVINGDVDVEITANNSNVKINAANGDFNAAGENIDIETNSDNGDIKIISPYSGDAYYTIDEDGNRDDDGGTGVFGTIRAALTNMDTEDLDSYGSSKVYLGKNEVALGMLNGRDMDEEETEPTVTANITNGIKVRKTNDGFYTQVVGDLETDDVTADSLDVEGTLTANNISLTEPLSVKSGGTGAATAAKARTNLGLDSTYRKYKYAYAGIGTDTGTDNWFKFAEISTSTNNVDLRISFKVSEGTGVGLSGYAGILTAHVRTTSAGAFYAAQSEFGWEYAGSKVKPENFVMAYSEGTPTVVELWVNIPTQYDYWHFDVIAEGRRNSNSNFTDWTLYQTTNYSSEITSGYTQLASTIGTLQNDTAGSAATLSETLAIEKGGTGAETAEDARANLGLGDEAVKGVDTEVTEGSENLITSGAVYEAIQAAINELYEKLTE